MAQIGEKFLGMISTVSQNKKAMVAIKLAAIAVFAAILTLSFEGAVFASADAPFEEAAHPVVDLINSLTTPLLLIVGAGGVIFCIILGVKYATAEEPQEREKRKQSLKTAIIGYILIFVLVVILKLTIKPLTDWMVSNSTATTTKGK